MCQNGGHSTSLISGEGKRSHWPRLCATAPSPRLYNSNYSAIFGEVRESRMFKKLGPAIAALLILAFGGVALLNYAHTEPSTEALDADLKAIQADIKSASDESASYNGGLIKFMIEMRKQILRTTEAMLESKRTSILRRVDLKYEIGGRAMAIKDEVGLKVIQQDIEIAKLKLQADRAETDHYSGGLLQSMALMATATDRTSLSQLYLAYYGKKYGLAMPETNVAPSNSEGPPPGPPGKVVKDKDAL